jgi:dTDP-4-dehydrorhamnose reductase
MEDMKWAARRPMDSSLDTFKATGELKEKPLYIEKALQKLREELAGS